MNWKSLKTLFYSQQKTAVKDQTIYMVTSSIKSNFLSTTQKVGELSNDRRQKKVLVFNHSG